MSRLSDRDHRYRSVASQTGLGYISDAFGALRRFLYPKQETPNGDAEAKSVERPYLQTIIGSAGESASPTNVKNVTDSLIEIGHMEPKKNGVFVLQLLTSSWGGILCDWPKEYQPMD